MRRLLAVLLLPLLIVPLLGTTGCARKKPPKKDYSRELAPGQIGLREVDINQVPDIPVGGNRAALREAIRQSLAFLDKKGSANWYPQAEITREQVLASLTAIDGLLADTTSDAEFNRQVKQRFRAFMSIGCDDQGTVLFTGYYTPIFNGSRTANSQYRFPLYKKPADFVAGKTVNDIATQKLANGETRPYPSAAEIEDGAMLKGQELVWLKDPYDAYLIRVQGSARLKLTDGSTMDLGFAGTNGHQYVGIGQALVADGKIPANKLSFFTMREHFRTHPEDVPHYTRKNPRYVFFAESKDGIRGCLNTAVTSDVTIATDKSIFPPAGPVVAVTHLSAGSEGRTESAEKPINYVGLRLDQDRGGAIRAAGRCDLYMGIGEGNERRAGGQYAEGKLFYLIAK